MPDSRKKLEIVTIQKSYRFFCGTRNASDLTLMCILSVNEAFLHFYMNPAVKATG